MFYISFYRSADIIFYNFLELHSTISEKRFSFLTDSLKPTPTPHSLNNQNPLSVTKAFCRCFLLCSQKIERQQRTPVTDRWYKKQDKKRKNKKLGIHFH